MTGGWWRTALLAAVSACAPAGGQNLPGAAAGGRFDAATVQRLCDEAAEALGAAAGLRLRQPVPALLLTAQAASDRRKAYAAELPPGDDAGATVAVDLVADLMFSESMLGRYLPDEQVLYVIEDVLEQVAAQSGRGDRAAAEDTLFAVLAHELTHAHDDQVYGLMPLPSELKALLADPLRIPELQARMGLLEGRATWAAELACEHAGRRKLAFFTLEEARAAEVLAPSAGEGGAQSAARGVINVLGRAKIVQYAYGREFARRAWEFGGEKFFAEVVAHLPLSMAELEDFERFKQRWAREMEAEMEAGKAEPAPDPGER